MVAVAAVAGACLLTAPSRADGGAVPVLGQSLSRGTIGSQAPEAVLTVHGVQRIDHGTVVYFSAGFPAGTEAASRLNLTLAVNDQYRKYAVSGRMNMTDTLASSAVIDPSSRTVYAGVMTPDKRCVCSSGLVLEHVDDKPGTAYALYVVVPKLPASVTTVSVSVGDHLFPGVQVQEGALTPVASGDGPVRVGSGWPAVDETALASVTDPEKSIYPLTQAVSDLSGQVTTRKRPTVTSVDVSSDVLFASDSATLSPKATASLRSVAQTLTDSGARGAVQVIGFTDSTNTEAYNLALSERRAAAVAAALKPLLPSSITLESTGRGESFPVASNETPEGRAQNRRVSLSFNQGAGR